MERFNILPFQRRKSIEPYSNVQDETGKKALINLETGSLATDLQISNTLSFTNLAKAQKMTRDFRDDFLDYWNEMKKAANGNL